jgi:hypothetical protein
MLPISGFEFRGAVETIDKGSGIVFSSRADHRDVRSFRVVSAVSKHLSLNSGARPAKFISTPEAHDSLCAQKWLNFVVS